MGAEARTDEDILADLSRAAPDERRYLADELFERHYARVGRWCFRLTGDRELAPMRSIMVGGRLEWDIPPGDDGEIGFFSSLMFVAKADYLTYDFDFHYGAVDVPNDFAVIGSFSLDASF